MIQKRTTLLTIAIAVFLFACSKGKDQVVDLYRPKFVVEGWIESDSYPTVILTKNVPYFSDLDSAELADVVLRYAKVTVSDGQKSEILTARKDDNYFPNYVYRGSEIRGVAGGKYKLTVEYGSYRLEAETTIPDPVPLDSIWFISKTDTSMQLNFKFRDPEAKNYYRVFTKGATNKRFMPTLLSVHDDKFFNGKSYSLQVNRGPESNLTTKNNPYFTKDEEVLVKLSTMPLEGFNFWNSFQTEVLSSSNPLMGSTGAIVSNIKGPALGLWCGYGASIYKAKAIP